MRKLLTATICLGLAACSQKTETSSSESGSRDPVIVTDATDSSAMHAGESANRAPPMLDVAPPPGAISAPGIGVTAAPGVAFVYRYAFRMPADKIAHAQEVHAQACEKLGPARCRITGMRFRLLGENNVAAILMFKLDPTLARGFGRDGIASVEAAGGRMVDAEISGNDAGTQIKRLDTDRARIEEQIKRIDSQLSNAKLSAYDRAQLQGERAQLQQTIAATQDSKAAQEDSLATTPMTFDYGAGPAVRGFDPSAPLTSAADTAIGSAQITLAVLLGALAVLGPPGLVVIAALLLWRRFRPRRATMPVTPTSMPAGE